MNISLDALAYTLIQLVVVVLSIVVHEVSHGLAAYRFGDMTAKNAGRLTLNPIAHIDPFGSVLLPLVMALSSGPVFAYAKPVPYNPANFKNRRVDELLVALAGPASNVVLALLGAGLAHAVASTYPTVDAGMQSMLLWVFRVAYFICVINLVLAFFNLIPLPPLDGSSLIAAVIPERWMGAFYTLKQYSMFILLVLLFLIPMVTPWDPLGWYMRSTAYALAGVLLP